MRDDKLPSLGDLPCYACGSHAIAKKSCSSSDYYECLLCRATIQYNAHLAGRAEAITCGAPTEDLSGARMHACRSDLGSFVCIPKKPNLIVALFRKMMRFFASTGIILSLQRRQDKHGRNKNVH
jgi:hypothetical protein